ncbi:MAG: autotransporter domain-containing protein, partial [Parvularculaceae bacterium]|nr:autotransporter domain-containing protein [Parvularculaceae bacterium]
AGFTGAAIAPGAELVLNGSIRALTINSGGRLSGVGTTGALVVNGALAPGNSIGTTNVVGTLTFGPTSTYAVEVGACSGLPCADRVIATGPVTINGGTVALSVFGTPGGIAGRVPIVTGQAVTGSFSTLSAPAGAFSGAFLEYTPTDVFLNFSLGPALTGATYGATSLAGAYGVTLLTRSLLSSSDDNIGRLPGSSGCALYVFSDGSPSKRVEGAPPDEDRTVTRAWARGLGAKGSIDGHGAALPGTDYHLTGFATGVERAGGGLSIGAGIGMLDSRVKAGGHLLDLETAHLMAYGGYESGPFSVGVALAAGRHRVRSTRADLAGDIARAAYSGWTYGTAIEAGYGFKSGQIEIKPYVGLDYTRTTFGAFAETGSSFGNLVAPRRKGDVLRTTV